MQSISGVLLTLFLSSLFSLSHSIDCEVTQYLHSIGNRELCCNKCKPGERWEGHCSASSSTRCVPCGKGYYSDRYDVERRCQKCSDCSMLHLEYKKNCAPTHDAECVCEHGYRCRSEPCLDCEKLTSRVADKSRTSTTTTIEGSWDTERTVTAGNQQKEEVPGTPRRDVEPGKEGTPSSMWSSHILLIACCCALLISVILVSRNKNVLRWIWRTTKGFRVVKETAAPNQCMEEEGKMPVQEVCEKLEVPGYIYS